MPAKVGIRFVGSPDSRRPRGIADMTAAVGQ
jgi:hypothetical protein